MGFEPLTSCPMHTQELVSGREAFVFDLESGNNGPLSHLIFSQQNANPA